MMKKKNKTGLSMILSVLITFLFAFALLLPMHAEASELVGEHSTIINGGFEDPDKKSEDTSNTGYKYTPQSEISGWATTSTNETIELGWLKNDGSSPHMKAITETSVISGVGASDGWQFAETIANEVSTIYQSLSLQKDSRYEWTVHHRGRDGVDTLALFLVDDAGINYVKSAVDASDHFFQIVTWMQGQGVAAPTEGDIVHYTVYTTALQASGAFAASDVGYFSFSSDAEHTVRFEVYLMSSGRSDWGEYTGTYLSDEDKSILFAMTEYESASSNNTSGNLIDNLSFSDAQGNNLLQNPGFDDTTASDKYAMVNAANAPAPLAKIGWCTTASDYKVEIGNLSKGNAYGLDVEVETITYNEPSIREGNQFAELNADQESSLYQIVDTVPDKMYKWSLSHRGRDGLDTMALVIGPKQSYLPKKTSVTARDQLMQIVDWLYVQTDVVLDIPDQGCSNEIKLYTPVFDDNGGFVTGSSIFSWYQDETHTEEWSVWIISSTNDTWHDYGAIEEGATYNYNYIVPHGHEDTIFGFVSVNSAPKASNGAIDKTYGNFLDNIAFQEYFYIDVDFDGNETVGDVYIEADSDESFIFDDETNDSGWGLADSIITIHYQVGTREFIGAYVNGVFFSKDDWQYDEEKGEYYYLYEVVSSLNINIVYQAQQVVYDSRSNYPYQYDPDDSDSGSEVPMQSGTVYTSHAPEGDDGWQFVGWRYIEIQEGGNNLHMFDAVHQVKCEEDGEGTKTLSLWEVDGIESVVSGISYDTGLIFFAEWKYRQRVIAQTYNKETKQYENSSDGGEVEITFGEETGADYEYYSKVVGQQLYASAGDTYINIVAKNDVSFAFVGWYDSSGEVLSRNPSYRYKIADGDVVDLYARFIPVGYDIIINVFGDSETSETYYAIECSFSNLLQNYFYAITGLSSEPIAVNGEQVTNPTLLRSDASGNAIVTLYMKRDDVSSFEQLPEDCVYSVQVNANSKSGYSVRDEVFDQTLTESTNIDLIWYKAKQTSLIEAGKYYTDIISQIGAITITQNSSYTFYVETLYTPSIYTGLNASLCFFDLEGVAQTFAVGTRILMMDKSNSSEIHFYIYAITSSVSQIPLTEFSALGTTSDEKYALPTGETLIEKLVFLIDYIDAADVQSGKISLVYGCCNEASGEAVSPVKGTVHIVDDTTELTVTSVSHDGYIASDRPVTIGITIKNSTPAINTTYENKLYAVKLSLNGVTLPVGSYVKVDGDCYYCDNGYIKIPSLGARDYTLKLYTPLPIYSQMELKVTLLSAISTSVQYPVEKSKIVNLDFVNGQSCALCVDIPEKVLSTGVLSQIGVQLKYQELDSVLLTISKKNADGTYTQLLNDIDVDLSTADEIVTIDLGNGLNVEAGATYIFSFVGYLGSYSMSFEECMVVGGYI